MLLYVVLLAILGLTKGQFVNGRKLETPSAESCAKRNIHEQWGGKNYFFSWRDSSLGEMDWLGARNYCRKRCMDTLSLSTKAENEFIKNKLLEEKVKYIWTSGRLCDFKGCDRPDLLPKNINGWFWTSELKKIPPTTDRVQNDWSASGGLMRPQPDNREKLQKGAPENCLAVLNNFYGDGIHWHDVACHHVKPFVCVDSKSLIDYIKYTNSRLQL